MQVRLVQSFTFSESSRRISNLIGSFLSFLAASTSCNPLTSGWDQSMHLFAPLGHLSLVVSSPS